MNEPPGVRLRVGLTGLTMAEYFRDEGRDILVFIDNIFRFVSGHGISGTLQLSVGSWIAITSMFAGGIVSALLMWRV